MSETAVLTINGTDVTGPSEWSMSWEERTDGSPGQFSAVIQDRSNTMLYGVTQRDHVKLALTSGFVLYDGEIVNSKLDLPVGAPWGRWNLGGSDWNTIPDLRLVGVPSGSTWLSIDGGLTFQNVDPLAQPGTNDSLTVAALFNNYVCRPYDGAAFDTATFVGTYLASGVLFNSGTGAYHIDWSGSHSPLRGSFDDVRSLGSRPIHFWIDPAGYVHWQAFDDVILGAGAGSSPIIFTQGVLSMRMPQSIPSLSPAAPAVLTDSSPDGVNSIGCRMLSFGFDATYMPQQAWVNGTTDYIYNLGDVIPQGTGWGDGAFGSGDPRKRQISVDAQAASVADRLAVGAAYTAYNSRARIKISATFGGRLDEGPVIDGWRCGQTVQIIDARLPSILNGLSWVIHAVKGKLVVGNPTTRLYTIECGDAPIGRFYAKYRSSPKSILTPRKPAYTHEIYFQNLSPALGEAQTLLSQMLDSSKKPVRASGIPVDWTLVVTLSGVVHASDATLSPTSASTNADGQTAVIFTADSATAGLTYKVTAATPAQ